MKSNLENILKVIVLILSWIIFSPFLLFFAHKWKLIGKGWRIILFILSPFMAIMYFLLTILIVWGCSEYDRKYGYTNNKTIERITGVEFPKLDIQKYNKGIKSFNGDYSDTFVLEMESELSESTYMILDSLSSGSTHWSFYDGEYRFSVMWGNGAVAPNGENPNEDRTFSLSFKKGNRLVYLSTGMW